MHKKEIIFEWREVDSTKRELTEKLVEHRACSVSAKRRIVLLKGGSHLKTGSFSI